MPIQTVAEQEQLIDAWAQEQNRRSTFDGRVLDLERLCQGLADAWASRGKRNAPEHESREWYANEILREIKEVREALTRGQWDRAASQAVVVGALAADADARHNWPAVRLGIKSLKSAQAGGRGRGKQITKDAGQLDAQIHQVLARYKSSDTRPTIRILARDLDKSTRTIQRHLHALGLKLPRF